MVRCLTISILPFFLPSKTFPNLLNHLPDTLQKPFQQIPSIHHKLLHEIVCLIQCFSKFRVFSLQLLILVHNIYKFFPQCFIPTGTTSHFIYLLCNFRFSLQLRCLLLQIHQSIALRFDISLNSVSSLVSLFYSFIRFLIIHLFNRHQHG